MSELQDQYNDILKKIIKLEKYQEKIENEGSYDDKIYKDLDDLYAKRDELEEAMIKEE